MFRDYFEFGSALKRYGLVIYRLMHRRGRCSNACCPKPANSMVLKTCAGCGDARYCDVGCQRCAWSREDVGRDDGEKGHRLQCKAVMKKVEELKETVGDVLLKREFDRKSFFEHGIVDMFPRDLSFRMRSGFEGLFPRVEVASLDIVRK